MTSANDQAKTFCAAFVAKWKTVLAANIADLDSLEPVVRPCMRRILGLVAWQTHLNRVGANPLPYQDELVVESLLSLQMSVIGHYKTAYILLRSLIENTFKLIYYKDHSVELRLAIRNPEDKQPVKSLSEYCQRLDELECLQPLDPIGKLYDDFSELSRFVHSQSPLYLHDVSTIDDLRFDAGRYRHFASTAQRVTENVTVLLTGVHRARFADMNIPEQSALLASLPAATRGTLRKVLSI